QRAGADRGRPQPRRLRRLPPRSERDPDRAFPATPPANHMNGTAHPNPPASADPAAPPTAARWRILALLLAYNSLNWFNRVSMPVAYDEKIHKQLGISEEAIGWVYSAMLIAYMLCMTPGGWLADRRGAWVALVFMGLGSALFVALTG